jgi:hypothetical protein
VLSNLFPQSRRRRRRKKGLTEQLRRRDAWARVQRVLIVLVAGSAIVFLSSYLAEKGAYSDMNFINRSSAPTATFR